MEHPNVLFYIYMDNIILGSPTSSGLRDLTDNSLIILKDNNFKVTPDKIQPIPPFKILVSILPLDLVSPAKPQLHIQDSYALPQLQKVLGEINWMRPWISVSTEQLALLFELLNGLDLSSQVTLSFYCKEILHQVQQAIDVEALRSFDPNLSSYISSLGKPCALHY